MKFLGKVEDPKDLTTKEYVDKGDAATNKAVEALEKNKVNSTDITSFTEAEIQTLWNKYIK